MPRDKPFIIGLTGQMGMGKTETAKLFAGEGVPVFDADAAVHALYAAPGSVATALEAAFPGVIGPDGVNRAALSRAVAGNAQKLAQLEAIIHPQVAAARADFLAAHAHAPVVLFDVPLLLETGIAVDAVVVASAPEPVRRARVLARPGMDAQTFAVLSARQFTDAQKRQQAHYVVITDKGLEHAREQVKMILADIRGKL